MRILLKLKMHQALFNLRMSNYENLRFQKKKKNNFTNYIFKLKFFFF